MVSSSLSDIARSELTALLGLANNVGLSNTDLFRLASNGGYLPADQDYNEYVYSLRQSVDDADLDTYYSALAQRKTRRVNIIMMGASIMEGHLSIGYNKTPAQQLAGLLRNFYGISGGGRGFMGVPAAPVQGTLAQVFTFTGGAFDDAVFAFGAKHQIWYATAAGHKVQWTVPPEGITSFVIQQGRGTGGAAAGAYYKIGAAAQVNFNTLSGVTDVNRVVVNTPVAGGTVIEIGWVAGTFVLDGVQEFNGDENSGIQVHNCGHASYSLANWNVSGGAPDWADYMAQLTPDLLILGDSGINDGYTLAGNKSAVAFKVDLLATITHLRARGVTCPIIILADYDVSATIALVDPWASYVTAMQQVAASDVTISFQDLGTRMPPSNQSAVLYAGDHLHSNGSGAGSLLIAQILRSKVTV